MKKINILWTDDEIDILRPHIIFLEQKGYDVTTATNGTDAIDLVQENHFDMIFLDENMPGLTGLQTLGAIKAIDPNVPVVIITKSEEEDIMDQAIGSKIADYLIKPVNPNQILLSVKKNVDQMELVTRKTTSDYQEEFSKIGMRLNERLDFDDWKEVYRKLIFWELELSESQDPAMDEVLRMQKEEANNNFGRYIRNNYLDWFRKGARRPVLSPDLFRNKVFPLLDKSGKVVVLLVDNLRYDQFRVLSKAISQYFLIEDEDLYYSILPTATMYARNAIFAGLMPSEIARLYPDLWEEDDNTGYKNIHEKALVEAQMSRLRRKERFYYGRAASNSKSEKKLSQMLESIQQSDLSVLVFNFVDMMSHARTEMEMIRELAGDEKAYRSLTLSWFNHSLLLELLKSLSESNVKVVLTTDHGTIRVNNPVKVIGDRETNTNLRYKLGRNLNYNSKQVLEITQPDLAFLPGRNVSSKFIFSLNNDFFVYPNNYNYYAQYYRDTFQHGGISLEEMIVPVITLAPK